MLRAVHVLKGCPQPPPQPPSRRGCTRYGSSLVSPSLDRLGAFLPGTGPCPVYRRNSRPQSLGLVSGNNRRRCAAREWIVRFEFSWAAAGVPAHPPPSITLRSGKVRSARSVFSPPLHPLEAFAAATCFLLRCQYEQGGCTAVKQKRHETKTCTTSSIFSALQTCFRCDERVTHGHRRAHRATGKDADGTLIRVGQGRSGPT